LGRHHHYHHYVYFPSNCDDDDDSYDMSSCFRQNWQRKDQPGDDSECGRIRVESFDYDIHLRLKGNLGNFGTSKIDQDNYQDS
jgi:hypothetical protein